jgi:hypothetical protein
MGEARGGCDLLGDLGGTRYAPNWICAGLPVDGCWLAPIGFDWDRAWTGSGDDLRMNPKHTAQVLGPWPTIDDAFAI